MPEDYTIRDPEEFLAQTDKGNSGAPHPEVLSKARVDLARYDTLPIPEREWGVRDRFPRRAVALLSGEGAIGKSVLFLQLAIAHVLGRDWLRSLPEPGPTQLVNCEDEGDELVRRLDPILKNYHAKFSDVAAGLHVFSLAIATRCWRCQIVLAAFCRRRSTPNCSNRRESYDRSAP
jgi:RecA-family ATPase